MIRLATEADAPLATQLLQEFAQQTGSTDFVADPARVATRIQRWPTIQAVDDVAGVYCELKIREKGNPNLPAGHPARSPNAEFSAAFPRGASKGLIGPVFATCAVEALRLLRAGSPGPARSYTLNELRAWQVWGTFLHGQDENQVPDGGRGICQSWETFYKGRGRLSIVAERLPGDSIWIARMRVEDLAADGP